MSDTLFQHSYSTRNFTGVCEFGVLEMKSVAVASLSVGPRASFYFPCSVFDAQAVPNGYVMRVLVFHGS